MQRIQISAVVKPSSLLDVHSITLQSAEEKQQKEAGDFSVHVVSKGKGIIIKNSNKGAIKLAFGK